MLPMKHLLITDQKEFMWSNIQHVSSTNGQPFKLLTHPMVTVWMDPGLGDEPLALLMELVLEELKRADPSFSQEHSKPYILYGSDRVGKSPELRGLRGLREASDQFYNLANTVPLPIPTHRSRPPKFPKDNPLWSSNGKDFLQPPEFFMDMEKLEKSVAQRYLNGEFMPTVAEVRAGTDTDKPVTPQSINDSLTSLQNYWSTPTPKKVSLTEENMRRYVRSICDTYGIPSNARMDNSRGNLGEVFNNMEKDMGEIMEKAKEETVDKIVNGESDMVPRGFFSEKALDRMREEANKVSEHMRKAVESLAAKSANTTRAKFPGEWKSSQDPRTRHGLDNTDCHLTDPIESPMEVGKSQQRIHDVKVELSFSTRKPHSGIVPVIDDQGRSRHPITGLLMDDPDTVTGPISMRDTLRELGD